MKYQAIYATPDDPDRDNIVVELDAEDDDHTVAQAHARFADHTRLVVKPVYGDAPDEHAPPTIDPRDYIDDVETP